MQTDRLGQGPWAEMSALGHVITLDGEEYDLDALCQDSEEMLEFADGRGNCVAHIVIPPRETETVSDGEVDEEGMEIVNEVPLPVNMDRVKVVLWTKVQDVDSDDDNMGGEE